MLKRKLLYRYTMHRYMHVLKYFTMKTTLKYCTMKSTLKYCYLSQPLEA